MDYFGLFLAGTLLCNAIPHLISGLRGETFFTPWAKPRGVGRSSALENVLWGAANLLVSVLLIDRIFPHDVPHGLVAIAIGFVGMGIFLALYFGRRQKS
ncbi:MAG: hypothetical protein JWO65_2048 [Sphingomonas bacterium]|nr:hypothetical protein [Sphingomonas bacterium]